MYVLTWAPAGFFSRGGQIRGYGVGLPSPAGSRDLGASSQKLTNVLKKCINNSSTKRFTVITNA